MGQPGRPVLVRRGVDGAPPRRQAARALQERTEAREADVTIGADRFSYTRAGETPREVKLGNQV